MKNEKNYSRNFLIILLVLISFNLKSFSQANNYNCCIKNITLVSPNVYEFDVVLEWTGTNSAKLTFLQAGIDFNYSALSNGGTITGAIVPGSADPSLPASQQSPNWVINQTSKQIRLLAAIATSSAIAAPIPGPPGFRVGTFRMTNSVPFSSTAPTFTWSFAPGSATKTVTALGVYLNSSTLSGNVTIPQNHCVLGASACPFASTGGPYYACGDVVLNGSLLNAVSGTWTTNGTGTFDPSNTALNATYHPSAADFTLDHINISLTTDPGNTGCTPYVSTSFIRFMTGASVDLGGPYVACNDYQFHITISGAPSYTMSTSGTGTFTNLIGGAPIYQSSAADLASGSVTITLTATGIQSCPVASESTTITYQPSNAVVFAGGPYYSCGDVTMHPAFNFNTLDGFDWSSSGTGTFTPSNTYTLPVYHPSPADLANGSVTITLTAHPAGLCLPASSTTTITYTSINDDNPCTIDACNSVTGNITHTDNAPTVNVTPGEINCYGGTTCVSVSATGGQTPYSGDGTLCGYGSGDHIITVTDANGCAVNSSVHLGEPDKLLLDCSSTPAHGNANDGSASVTVSGGNPPYSYQWSTGHTTNQINNLVVGTYCVVVTDANGCTASCCTLVGNACDLNAPGPISGPNSACKKQSGVVFCVSTSPNYISYSWILPAGVIVTGPTDGNCITVKFTSVFQGGFICVKANTSCGTTAISCTNVILVTKKPNVPGAISGPSSLCPGETASYSVAAVTNASSYSWNASGNISILSQNGNTVLVKASNNWNAGDLKVKASNCKGSSGFRTKHISKTPGCRLSNSQVGNTGTKENISEFIVYPNPTTDQLTISCNSQNAASAYLRISDLTGRIVYIDKLPIVAGQNSKLLSLKDLSEGSYTVTLQLDNGDFKSVQIVRAK